MSYTKIWIHGVWATKNRQKFLNKDVRVSLFEHIKENAIKKDIFLDSINGYNDHIHVLLCLKREQNIADCIQLIKGESSFWINKNKLTSQKFEWQDDYFAVSVSNSKITVLRSYIKNQEEHHKSISYSDEYDEFMKNYGFDQNRNG
ncbi:MAG: IS200/IS605 family transposase [Bacteroidales bacterium]